MGCGTSKSVTTGSQTSVRKSPNDSASSSTVLHRGTKVEPSRKDPTEKSLTDASPSHNAGPDRRGSKARENIAFEVMLGDREMAKKPVPKRLSRLEPIDAPRLTAEELEEKMRLAERKRNSELEARAKTASETRRQSKRKRELMIARELEKQHQQARELEQKLKSAEKQRELQQQQKTERQRIHEERMKRVQNRKEKLCQDDVISDVEQDENFNNDDVDSWLEGSNNDTNTVDTGFSSATSERIYSGRESPKKKPYNHQQSLLSRSSYLNSASTVDSCDKLTYRTARQQSSRQNYGSDQRIIEPEDDFFDT